MTDLNIQVLQKGKEIYVFLFPDEQRNECIRTLGRFAANPELSLTWMDAAKLCQAIKREVKGAGAGAWAGAWAWARAGAGARAWARADYWLACANELERLIAEAK